MDVSHIFFFSARGRGKSPRGGRGGGDDFSWRVSERGAVSPASGGGGGGAGRVVRGMGGGGPGSVTVREWNGSSGSGFRFWRFLCKKVFLCISTV